MEDESNEDKKTIKQAIDTVVSNFAKHAFAHGHGKGLFSSPNKLKIFLKKNFVKFIVNVIEALQEFWSMKYANTPENSLIIHEYLIELRPYALVY